MTTIAFIGLGIMGLPMASNLVNAGFDVVGVNRSPDKAARLVERGGRTAGDIPTAVAKADAVVTMLPDSPDVEAVMFGPAGVLANAPRGALVIDSSTIRPETSRAVAEQAAGFGLRALDAPVSGGEAGAIEGNLSIMVGGESAAFEDARHILDAMGSTVVHVGASGAGQTVKAANQLIVAGNIQLLAEAIVFLGAHEVELESAVRVLAGGLAGSTVINRKAAGMLAHNFAPGFRVDLHHKDLGIVIETARASGVSIPLGSHVADLLASLRSQGGGELDHSALLLQVERLSGLKTELATDAP